MQYIPILVEKKNNNLKITFVNLSVETEIQKNVFCKPEKKKKLV